MKIENKSALKKYNSICDDFILPPQLKKFSKESDGKAMALAHDMSKIKESSIHPSEFRSIAFYYLSDRPAIVASFKDHSINDVATKFTIMTIVEQEFRVLLDKMDLHYEDVDINMTEDDEHLGLALGFRKSVPTKKAEAFHRLLDKRLKSILHVTSTVQHVDTDSNDISEYSEYLEDLDIDDIRGEA
tara:strand:+ start:91 stop:651 length:561 start_codon:yes stop_codon:yes gene_type:complete